MIRSIEIENFKSIVSASIDLGRVNVFIGENGAGKSNILEAVALAGAANAQKLDNEFLTSRGIRVIQPKLMRPAFSVDGAASDVTIAVTDSDGLKVSYLLQNDNAPYAKWKCSFHPILSSASETKIEKSLLNFQQDHKLDPKK